MAEEIKTLQTVYLTSEVRIRKDGDKYFVETNIEGVDTSEEIDFNVLSRISKNISLMVFEHHNPDHHNLKPIGFK